MEFRNCSIRGVQIRTPIVESVTIWNLKTHTDLCTWGAVFKHVTLRGRVGRVMISQAIGLGLAKPHQQRAFDIANADYYRAVDWAVDIREAEFVDADLRGVPGELVLRDTKTQALIRREAAMRGDWMKLDLSGTYWPTAIDFFLKQQQFDSNVLVACKRDPKFSVHLDGLRRLRDVGVVEMD